MIYLVDKSAWMQLQYHEPAQDRLSGLGREGEIATCPAIANEILYSARDYAHLLDLRTRLEQLLWLETSDDAAQRTLGVQRELARHGHHRGVSLVDLMVAATAEAHWATVLHYDSDFERIAEVTGQPHEWIVPRGEGHRRN